MEGEANCPSPAFCGRRSWLKMQLVRPQEAPAGQATLLNRFVVLKTIFTFVSLFTLARQQSLLQRSGRALGFICGMAARANSWALLWAWDERIL